MNNMSNKIRDKFDGSRRLRPWRNSHFGGLQAAKAHPVAMCLFLPNEGGSVVTNLNLKLAPVSGYMRSNAYVEIVQIAVPYQAIEKLELDTQEDAGVTEMARRRLMAGAGIGLEEQGIITKAANIHPRSIGGVKKLNKSARLAYIAACNHMRLSSYFKASQLDKTATAIQPAVLTANILERFSGVLEPETLVDGAVNLTGDLPVKGIGIVQSNPASAHTTVREGHKYGTLTGWGVGDTHGGNKLVLENHADEVDGYVGALNVPHVRADLSGAGEVSLREMVKSKKLDELVRMFAAKIKADPVNGEEVVERSMYSIALDYDHNCQVLYHDTVELSPTHQRPTDGASINDVSAHFELNEQFATQVPRSELGLQLVTLVSVKPVETLQKQPDPHQTLPWQLVNIIHDETELEETLLTRADLESDVDAADEDTPAFWVGHNALRHDYSTQGVNDQQVLDVEMKSSMWLYEVPTSVTPENILYPEEGVTMYPFFNWNGAHAEYTVDQRALISTSLAKGPTPVERIQLFKDDPTLVDDDA